MRFVWHSDNLCSVHQRDATIIIYAHWVQKIHTLLDEDLEGAYLQLMVRQKCKPLTKCKMVWFFISFDHCLLKKISVQKKLRPLKHFGRKGSLNELVYSIKPGILNLSRWCPISCILPGKKPLQTLKQESKNGQMWGVWTLQPYTTAKQRAYLCTSRVRQLQQKLSIIGYEDWLCPRHASGTFATESKLRANRRWKFLHSVSRSKPR